MKLNDYFGVPPDGNLMPDLTNSMTDRAAAIVMSTYVEYWLEVAVASKMTALRDTMFDYDKGGPLAELASKAKMARALGFIGPQTFEDIKRIRKVRNVFAHSAWDISFQTEAIKSTCLALGAADRHTVGQATIIQVLRNHEPETIERRLYELTSYWICSALEANLNGKLPQELAKMLD